MSDSINFSTIIGDVVRWVVLLILFPTIFWIIGLSLLYPFEWLLIKTTNWDYSKHLVFWLVILFSLIAFIVTIVKLVCMLAFYIVRQKIAAAWVNQLFSLGLIVLLLYSTWSSAVTFSWELLPYTFTNKIFFSILCLSCSNFKAVAIFHEMKSE